MCQRRMRALQLKSDQLMTQSSDKQLFAKRSPWKFGWPRLCFVLAAVCFLAFTPHSFGQVLTDPGFESYAVSAGQFVRPAAGAWSFVNDAGVVEPFAGNSSTGTLNTWSATLPAYEGAQYASTYASLDSIRQTVVFSSAGDYEISVFAASPAGSLTIPGVGNSTLVDGEFTFALGNAAVGATHVVDAGGAWERYSATLSIPAAGNYQLGIRNTLAAAYFINYDAFSIRSVPEPSTLGLGVVAVLLLSMRIRKWRPRGGERHTA